MGSRSHQRGANGAPVLYNEGVRQMPLLIENNYDDVSLMDLVSLREQGYSVLKSPHVGNQHPSNLVCAALGISLEMVSFTQGVRDVNFHPHLRIAGGCSKELYSPATWTPFASVEEAREISMISFFPPSLYASKVSATTYHQSSVQELFPNTEVITDMERMQMYPALAATVLHVTNQVIRGMWYRHVSKDGVVTKQTQSYLSASTLETDIFQFSNNASGWVVPNLVHIIFDLVYQTLSSGRDVVYHLSGPQMVQYVGGYADKLELMYDALRQHIPALPLTLKARIVPVAAARFMTVPERVEALATFAEVRDQLQNSVVAREFVTQYPEFTQSIESGTTLSQYDFKDMRDIKMDAWMLVAPLSEVTALYESLTHVARSPALPAA